MASALELTRIEEDENENGNNDQYIDQLPQPTHSSPVPRTSYSQYQDDCATSKNFKHKEETSPVTAEQREPSSSSSSTPSQIATSTDDEGAVEITPVSPSPWMIGKQRISKSLDIKEQQMQRDLGTFKRFHSQDNTKRGELVQSPESKGQNLIKTKEIKKGRGRPRKDKTAADTQPDAVENTATAKPQTCSRDRAIEPRAKINHTNSDVQNTSKDDRSVQTQCPSGSKLAINKIAIAKE